MIDIAVRYCMSSARKWTVDKYRIVDFYCDPIS